STYWNMVYSQLSREVESDLEGIENMKNTGQNMACILKK
ncbi:FMN reductase, partial [Massilimicrobiota timonensis]